ncbi:MAG: short-chain dehydrogenase/reductase [Rhodospirillales bacterium]|nr:short-chain dehydrogenase/reductase [Rhodospirillales bacterium]
MTSLSGRLAVVSGASSGIGRACAIALAAAGADLLLLGRDEERLREAAAAARDLPATASATYLAADLTDDGAASAVAELAAKAGGAAVLVHSAGIYERAALAEAAIEAFDRQYRANIRAPYRLTQALLPQLVQRQGDIVFINSTQGLAAAPGIGQFAATQHAMKAVADALRGEINDSGVRVMTLHAGRTATPRQARIFSGEGRDYRPELLMQPEDVAAMVVATIALPRSAEVTSIALRPMRKS